MTDTSTPVVPHAAHPGTTPAGATRKHDMVREQLRMVGAHQSADGLATLELAARYDHVVHAGGPKLVREALARDLRAQLSRTLSNLARSGDPGRIAIAAVQADRVSDTTVALMRRNRAIRGFW